jgi:hypothetical protein
MFRKLLMAAIIACPLLLVQAAAAQEEEKSRLNKQEVIDLMVKAGKTPAAQQKGKLDLIWKDLSGSKTPRADFLFCAGLAYLGNHKAQRCVASAYESGIGIVEDLSEAYGWYSVALENRALDQGAKELLQADRDRVQMRLLAAYPHPTEDDLDDLVKAQKLRITQYQQDVKTARK